MRGAKKQPANEITVFVSVRHKYVRNTANVEFPVRCCKSQVRLLEFGNVEVQLMASQKTVSPAEPLSADANPSKVVWRYPKLDYSKQDWIGVNIDLEERKIADFYLAEGQRLAHMGSRAFNAAGFDYWSSELFQIHGLDPSGKAPTVQEYMNLVHPENRGLVGQAIQKMLTDRRGFDFTKRIVRADGKIRYIRCVGVPVTHGATFQGFVGTGMDVTEQEQLAKELQRREAFLAKAQRLSHTGTFGWNVSTDEHFWSEETFRIFEFPPSSKVSL